MSAAELAPPARVELTASWFPEPRSLGFPLPAHRSGAFSADGQEQQPEATPLFPTASGRGQQLLFQSTPQALRFKLQLLCLLSEKQPQSSLANPDGNPGGQEIQHMRSESNRENSGPPCPGLVPTELVFSQHLARAVAMAAAGVACGCQCNWLAALGVCRGPPDPCWSRQVGAGNILGRPEGGLGPVTPSALPSPRQRLHVLCCTLWASLDGTGVQVSQYREREEVPRKKSK